MIEKCKPLLDYIFIAMITIKFIKNYNRLYHSPMSPFTSDNDTLWYPDAALQNLIPTKFVGIRFLFVFLHAVAVKEPPAKPCK